MTVPARGSTETTLIPLLGRWDISVQGPNRFWYDAKGSITGAAREVDVEALELSGDRIAEAEQVGPDVEPDDEPAALVDLRDEVLRLGGGIGPQGIE